MSSRRPPVRRSRASSSGRWTPTASCRSRSGCDGDLGVTVVRLSLQGLASTEWTWELGTGVRLIEAVEPRGNWSGIWRRPGHAHVDDIASKYATFANSESRDAFRGGLLASGIRWVNHPRNLWFAEHKVVQLESARRLGIRVPRTIVTNDEDVASAFVQDVGSVMAKAVRYGLVATDSHSHDGLGSTYRAG